MNHFLLFHAVVSMSLFAGSLTAHAAQRKTGRDAAPARTLDEQLFDDLDSDLFDDLDVSQPLPEGGPDDRNGPVRSQPQNRELDRAQPDLLHQGEDIGSDQAVDPLTRIGQRMRDVEHRMSQKDTSEDTQRLQQRVVDELDQLLRLAKQQHKHQSGGGQPSSNVRQRKSVRQTQPPTEEQLRKNTNRGSGDSAQRVGTAPPGQVDWDPSHVLGKEIWGHLPEQQREQMILQQSEQFLPQYKLLIEEYFKRLAEDEE